MRLRALAAIWLAALALLAAPTSAGAAKARAPKAASKAPAAAIPAGYNVSYSLWTIEGSAVRLRVMLPKPAALALSDRGQPALAVSDIANLVHDQLAVTSAGGDCLPIDQGEGIGEIYTLALTPDQHRFEMIFSCPTPDGIVLHDHLLFDRAAGHVNFARVRIGAAAPTLQMFTADHQTLALSPAHGQLSDVSGERVARLSAWQLFHAFDVLAIVAGLLVLSLRWGDLLSIAAGLTAGYLASLAAGLSGAVTVDVGLDAAAIGLLAAILGASALRSSATAPATAPSRLRTWLWRALIIFGVLAAIAVSWRFKGVSAALLVAGLLIFGLALLWLARPRPAAFLALPAALLGALSGFGPAGNLTALGLPAGRLVPTLASYDGTQIIVILVLVAAAMAVLWLAVRKLITLRPAVLEIAGAALLASGAFWFVSRLYS